MKKHIRAIVIAIVILLLAAVGIVAATVLRKDRKTQIKDYHTELFGDNVYVFSPDDNVEEVQKILDDMYQKQESNQFGDERYSIYFMPGEYDESLQVNLGFYMQVAGLGETPTQTAIPALRCEARWLEPGSSNHNACCNFWRGVENIEVQSNTMFAVSQATFMRRTQIDGALFLHDENGWCSGGFLADSNIDLMVDSGSQQQWLSRNCNWKQWMGSNWNMVFAGIEAGKAPNGAWPAIPYTKVEETEVIREKPFLMYEKGEFYVAVPLFKENSTGTSWQNEASMDKLPISDFYIAKADKDNADTINEALEQGRNLFLTPGIYELDKPIVINDDNTVVLGSGLATLRPVKGTEAIVTNTSNGLIIAGLLIDAGGVETQQLMVVNQSEQAADTDTDAMLSDLFFRVGGAPASQPARTKSCLVINADNVVGDNFWIWRADHGDQVAWDLNTAANGLIVNGDNVLIYALMVEHFQEYQTIWNGENGKIIMYQSEIPYDVPSQDVWMSRDGTRRGYSSIFVADDVEQFEAWGLGIYLYNRDAKVCLESAMEIPDRTGVKVHNICTVLLTGNPGMNHVINDQGGSVYSPSERKVICEYENGIIK